ncbi:MAG: hypothetical protein EPO31_00855 [Gammaproteobacteria bacterium]|nr:MAG: hypothetical protein EPO31_00855 [Gammaproteobacteria bacterium]
MRRLAALLIVCLGAMAATAAGMRVEVIPLNHRTVEELVPIIRPLLTEGGSVTGMNDQLIVKTDDANLEDIKRILETLDRPLRRLMITVSQDIATTGLDAAAGAAGQWRTGTRGREGDLRLDAGIASTGNTDNNDFRLQTVEGQPAFIETGQAVPIENRNAWVTGNGVVVQDTVEYHQLGSGFYVLPILSGAEVTLYISPRMERLRVTDRGQPVFDIQQAETTVRGRLGEWIMLGGIDQATSRRDSGLIYSTRNQHQEQRTMAILVEEVP